MRGREPEADLLQAVGLDDSDGNAQAAGVRQIFAYDSDGDALVAGIG